MIEKKKKLFFFFAAAFAVAGPAGAWEAHFAGDGQYQRWVFKSAQPLVIRLIDPPAGLFKD